MFARLMGLHSISPAALHRRLQDGERIAVIDVNPPERWAKHHVSGARNLDPTGYGEHELPADKQAPLVFYCSGAMCRKAPRAARRATQLGYADVAVMSAGIGGWMAATLPTESVGG